MQDLEVGKRYYFDNSKKSHGVFEGIDEDDILKFTDYTNKGGYISVNGCIMFSKKYKFIPYYENPS